MFLSHIELRNFRNFEKAVFDFNKELTLIIGNNSVGKTNLLESIHFICTGKGLKEEKIEDFIMFEKDESDVKATFDNDTHEQILRIYLRKNTSTDKAYFIDHAKKTLMQYKKFTPACVVFSPELISIIDGQPSFRRKFVDSTLSRIDPEYNKRLRNYENAIRRRNKILEKEHDQIKLSEELQFWNDYLIEQASYISAKRIWFCDEINSGKKIKTHPFVIFYDENKISKERFKEYFMKEYYQKRTLIGIQRDDFRISLTYSEKKPVDVHIYSSRGEQRLALFWLILNQLMIYDMNLEIRPLVLLDDIFSELDNKNKALVTEVISQYQTIVTTTEEEYVHKKNNTSIINL